MISTDTTAIADRQEHIAAPRPITEGKQMIRSTRTRIAAAALGCVLAGVLLSAGPASAASRRFTLTNHSQQNLVVAGIRDVQECFFWGWGCVDKPVDKAFEGHPHVGTVLHPNAVHDWELEFTFSHAWRAVLIYRIEGTHWEAQYEIGVGSFANTSSACRIVVKPHTPFPLRTRCLADGQTLRYVYPVGRGR
jgi:hypothetical protein